MVIIIPKLNQITNLIYRFTDGLVVIISVNHLNFKKNVDNLLTNGLFPEKNVNILLF
jgi:hypothetical protein